VEGQQTVTIDTAGLQTLEVKTHNGRVAFDGTNDATQAIAQVHIRGGAWSKEEAQVALDAIEVFVEPGKQGRQLLGWRWNPPKKHSWRGQVSFDISGPVEVNLEVETHNGRVEVSGVQGSVTTVTHNGRINVSTAKGKLYARTHNGRIEADYDGEDVTLITHNGTISAQLDKCQEIRGKMVTHNGSVKVTLGDSVSTFVDAQTHNGRISCDLPIDVQNRSRRHLTGALGNGGGRLNLTTHNGGINIK
jgi:DUF4097 and DUF4098 domain-containing protein YvlB